MESSISFWLQKLLFFQFCENIGKMLTGCTRPSLFCHSSPPLLRNHSFFYPETCPTTTIQTPINKNHQVSHSNSKIFILVFRKSLVRLQQMHSNSEKSRRRLYFLGLTGWFLFLRVVFISIWTVFRLTLASNYNTTWRILLAVKGVELILEVKDRTC